MNPEYDFVQSILDGNVKVLGNYIFINELVGSTTGKDIVNV